MPDIVASLRVDQDWGSAQLSAALHQLNSADIGIGAGGVGPGRAPSAAASAQNMAMASRPA